MCMTINIGAKELGVIVYLCCEKVRRSAAATYLLMTSYIMLSYSLGFRYQYAINCTVEFHHFCVSFHKCEQT